MIDKKNKTHFNNYDDYSETDYCVQHTHFDHWDLHCWRWFEEIDNKRSVKKICLCWCINKMSTVDKAGKNDCKHCSADKVDKKIETFETDHTDKMNSY